MSRKDWQHWMLHIVVILIMGAMVVVGYYLLACGIRLIHGGKTPSEQYYEHMRE